MADRVYGVLLVSFSKHSHQRSFIPAFVDHPGSASSGWRTTRTSTLISSR